LLATMQFCTVRTAVLSVVMLKIPPPESRAVLFRTVQFASAIPRLTIPPPEEVGAFPPAMLGR